MRAIFVPFALFASVLVVQGNQELKDFAAPDGSCKAQFPGTPKASVRDVDGQKMHVFMVEEKNGAYGLLYADGAEKGLENAVIQKAFDLARDNMLRSLGAKLLKESKITIGTKKYPGREFVGELPNDRGLIRAKIYSVDGRLYQMLIVGKKNFAESETATQFLGSLTLLK